MEMSGPNPMSWREGGGTKKRRKNKKSKEKRNFGSEETRRGGMYGGAIGVGARASGATMYWGSVETPGSGGTMYGASTGAGASGSSMCGASGGDRGSRDRKHGGAGTGREGGIPRGASTWTGKPGGTTYCVLGEGGATWNAMYQGSGSTGAHEDADSGTGRPGSRVYWSRNKTVASRGASWASGGSTEASGGSARALGASGAAVWAPECSTGESGGSTGALGASVGASGGAAWASGGSIGASICSAEASEHPMQGGSSGTETFGDTQISDAVETATETVTEKWSEISEEWDAILEATIEVGASEVAESEAGLAEGASGVAESGTGLVEGAAVAPCASEGAEGDEGIFGFDVNAELVEGVQVSKYTRQFINAFKGMENYSYNKDLPYPETAIDWDTEQNQAIVLEAKFPDPRELSDAIACSWCEKIAEPPVYMCANGHLICGKELHVIPTCPHMRLKMCYAPFVSTRPLFIEYLYNNVVVECRNRSKGCPVVLLGRDMLLHQSTDCAYALQAKIERIFDMGETSLTNN